MPGISAVSPPTKAQPACLHPSAMPAMTCVGGGDVKLAGGEIIEEQQRFRALHDKVVDAHGDKIDADGVVLVGVDGDF